MEYEKTGKLKIFFGYCAGVGKTYAMLSAAHAKRKEGVDVVVGYIEHHDRKDTLALLDGLECIPELMIAYHDVILHEFHLDEALKRHPSLILVDELAHTNAKGSRHPKRYSDIQELLHAGIDVYTTLNVQHLESLHDAVAAITRIRVNERIPDKIFDMANQVELIDIEPDDLIKRLNEGKIYQKQQARSAMQHFFVKDNLIALREIALRKCAQHVNQLEALCNRPFTSEHILVCLSPAPSNEKVIRTAARLAAVFFAKLSALYVENPQNEILDTKEQKTLENHLQLAKHFHADIVSVYGEDTAQQIAEYAKLSGVSKVVLGRSNSKRTLFSKPTLVDHLTQLAPDLDIYIIPNQNNGHDYHEKKLKKNLSVSYQKDIGLTLMIFSAVTLWNAILFHFQTMESNLIMMYLLAVFLISYFTSRKIFGILSSILVVIVFNFFFTIPRFSLEAYDPEYLLTFILLFLVSIITNTLTRKVKRQARNNAIQSHRLQILLETSQKLQLSYSIKEVTAVTCTSIYQLLHRTIILYPVKDDRLQPPQLYNEFLSESETAIFLSTYEQAVAKWVSVNNKRAGAFTSTLPAAKATYYAIRYQTHIYAVIGISMINKEPLEPFEQSVLAALLNVIATAMDHMYKQHQKNST